MLRWQRILYDFLGSLLAVALITQHTARERTAVTTSTMSTLGLGF